MQIEAAHADGANHNFQRLRQHISRSVLYPMPA
jgi:hypothetical protein